jgi:hypothetical protein
MPIIFAIAALLLRVLSLARMALEWVIVNLSDAENRASDAD